MTTIKLTTRQDLRHLMAYEFHKDNQKDFDPTEPANYLQRLTKAQEYVLKKYGQEQHITAFIVFGDGYIDRPFGGTIVTDKIYNENIIIRPNSSLALFTKKSTGDFELLFYTRFLETSYALFNKSAEEVRKLCKDLDTELNSTKRTELKVKIFKYMNNLYTVKNLTPVTRAPPMYYFYIRTIRGMHTHYSSCQWVPFIRVTDSSNNYAPYFGKGNTIHGTIDTQGCWMLFRNYLWDWPKENVGNTYILLARAYLYYRIPNAYDTRTKDQINAALGKYLTANQFLDDAQNYTYYDFIRKFAGIHYNHQDDNIKIPSREKMFVVFSGNNTGSSFKTNLPEDVDDFWQGEMLEFRTPPLNGQKKKVVGYNGSTKTIYVQPGFYPAPQAGAEFILDNCWSGTPKPKWGPNILGKKYGYNKPWATVFGFRRTKRFTLDSGDTETFDK